MPKVSVSKAKPPPTKIDYFYGNEILPDFRARKEATLKDLEAVPPDDPTEVGMPTINPKSEVQKYFVEFCSGSTMLGFNHIVAPHRHPLEKYLAMVFVGIALMLLAFLSITFWHRFQYDATVIGIDIDHDHFEVMKPAVFICPVPNIEKSKFAEAFKNNSIEYTPEAEKFFTFLANVNYQNMRETPDFDLVPPEKWLKILHEIRRDIPQLALKQPDPYGTVIITERGLCSANRNSVAVYSTYEYWMSNNWTVVPEPEHVPVFDYNDDRSSETYTTKNDALFALIDPSETMSFNQPVKSMKPKLLQRPIVSMFVIKTKSNVQGLQVHQRRCKFSRDGGLKTWPIYTYHMCIIECRMRKIQHHCKCRPHFARPIDGIEICNGKQLRCIGDIVDKLFLWSSVPEYCNCIPQCNRITYLLTDTKPSELNVPTTQSSITVVIDFPTIFLVRSILYGFSDFLSSVGGAAGLLLGASVLSFVEIVYYATVHAYFYARRAKQRKKKILLKV
ncbi:acid-sensing ion channel 1 isoform X2 [Halictus rubicundus]|uniref:acid-sensing ion channel 1 isoform X2 n=1 Tax=Halictus rubicundus TaxID=77578 RepID=UPI00403607BB